MRVLGYLRVSTSEQADSRAGLEVQRASILAEAERRGWSEVTIIEDAGYSAKDMRRPGLAAALSMLRGREADALVVSKMDRLSRSLLDFAGIMQRAQREGWALVALDSPADLTSPTGEAMAGVLAVFAQLERRLIGERTKAALAQRRSEGVVLGRPRLVSPEVEDRVRALRAEGLTVREIGRRLTAEGHLPPRGGDWQPSTLQRILTRARAL
jgi:DNA invertase Pin-like site-specific DNA recombinase